MQVKFHSDISKVVHGLILYYIKVTLYKETSPIIENMSRTGFVRTVVDHDRSFNSWVFFLHFALPTFSLLGAAGAGGCCVLWRMGCQLPALLSDGENTVSVPLSPSSHFPNSADPCCCGAPVHSHTEVTLERNVMFVTNVFSELLV